MRKTGLFSSLIPSSGLSLAGHVARHPKAGPAIALDRLEPKAAGRTAGPAFVQPAAAADHYEVIPQAVRHHAVFRPLRIFLGTLLVVIRVITSTATSPTAVQRKGLSCAARRRSALTRRTRGPVQHAWQRLAPSFFHPKNGGSPDNPAESDAREFCTKLSALPEEKKAGRTSCPSLSRTGLA
jgi:hypothetical protein